MRFKDFLEKKLIEQDEFSKSEKSLENPPQDTNPSQVQQTNKDQAQQNVQNTTLPTSVKPKWKASKKQILNYWNGLRSDQPVSMQPIKYDHKGSTYGEDGIRINGSPNFIQAILGKLKDLLKYEGENTKLAVAYRQTMSKKRLQMGLNPISYVFYIQAKERGKKRKN